MATDQNHQPDHDPRQENPTSENLSLITELTPAMTGRWLVTAKTSTHVWNLEPGNWTYTRIPGPDATPMEHDHVAVPIGTVGKWPKVGEQSLVFYDDPSDPTMEQWRICSRIHSIESLAVMPQLGKPTTSPSKV